MGVHGKPATLHLVSLWIGGSTVTTGLVDATSTDTLLRLIESRQINAARFVTRRFGLDDILTADDIFGRAAETGAIKVMITR